VRLPARPSVRLRPAGYGFTWNGNAATELANAVTKLANAVTKLVNAATKLTNAATKLANAVTKLANAATELTSLVALRSEGAAALSDVANASTLAHQAVPSIRFPAHEAAPFPTARRVAVFTGTVGDPRAALALAETLAPPQEVPGTYSGSAGVEA